MSDFDFDELDKAVAGATSADTSEEVVVAELPAEEPVSEPVSRVIAQPFVDPPAPEKLVTPDVAKAAPASRRSSGRFMDVVHPSSDMRTRTSPAVVESNPPLSPEKPSFVPPVSKKEEAPEEELDEVEQAFKAAEEDGAVGEWSKPLETPFLADAKVEKRPLGGVGPEPSQMLLDAPEEELLLEETTLPDPIDFAAQVEALKSETEDTGESVVEETDPKEQTIEQLDELKEPETSEPQVLEVVKSEEPVGPTSISQQYTEQPVEQKESGAIFDTENYHQPLAPAPKKHSSVWTVIWILLLVIAGAGAGVAFYLFVLPQL